MSWEREEVDRVADLRGPTRLHGRRLLRGGFASLPSQRGAESAAEVTCADAMANAKSALSLGINGVDDWGIAVTGSQNPARSDRKVAVKA